MLNAWTLGVPDRTKRRAGLGVLIALATAGAGITGLAQQTKLVNDSGKPAEVYLPIPGFDATSLDTSANPCNDFYKFACGKFATNHPIPADQAGVDQFYALYNVNTQSLNGILNKAAAGGAGRSPDEQKIGDYYKARSKRRESHRLSLC
jgi:endothelin-converting enzyme/putative endopeptidase